MALAELFRQVPLLAGLSADSTSLLANSANSRSFRRGQAIVHKGDPGDAMFLIRRGRVKVVLPSERGEEVFLGILRSGDVFGELSLIDGEARSATVVAIEPTDTVMIRREDLDSAMRARPALAVELLGVLAQRLRKTNELAEDAVFLDVRARLAKRLLELAEAYGVVGPDGIAIGLHLTQKELAEMVGATRGSVYRHLSGLQALGIIEVQRRRIVVRRPAELHRRIY